MHSNLFCYTFSCDISVVTRFLKARENVNAAYIINTLVTSTCGKEIEYLITKIQTKASKKICVYLA
jgi:hypothetical protein